VGLLKVEQRDHSEHRSLLFITGRNVILADGLSQFLAERIMLFVQYLEIVRQGVDFISDSGDDTVIIAFANIGFAAEYLLLTVGEDCSVFFISHRLPFLLAHVTLYGSYADNSYHQQ